MSLVLDASLTLAWFFADEATEAADLVLDQVTAEGAVVPPLWRFETANGLHMAVRRKRIDAAFRDQALRTLAALPITPDPESDRHAWASTLLLAERHGLTLYDAAYLELATRRKLPLASGDTALRAAARASGVPLLGMAGE